MVEEIEKINIDLLQKELYINEVFPGLSIKEKTTVLIDDNNFFYRSKSEGFKVDYVKLKNILSARCNILDFIVFSSINPEDKDTKAWIKALESNDILVVTKPIKMTHDEKDNLITKGNMDVEITIRSMKISSEVNHVIIGSCDGDFVPLVEELRQGGFEKTSVLGISNHRGLGMSKEMISVGRYFYDLLKIRDYVKNERSIRGQFRNS